jgi:cell wall-associated NlpC family hydrolase
VSWDESATKGPGGSGPDPLASLGRLLSEVRGVYVRSFRTHTRRPIAVLGVAAAILALVLLPGGGANAAPSPADAENQLQALGVKMDKINEQANSARIQLKRVQAQKVGLDRQMSASRTTMETSRAAVSRIAVSAYRDGGMRMSSSLINGSPSEFLDQMADLEWLSSQQRQTVTTAQEHQSQYDDAKKRVDLQVQNASRLEKKLASQKAQIAKDQSKWQRIKQEAGGNGYGSGNNGNSGSTHVTYNGPASGNGAAVVRYALAQQGEPYVFGAAGPNSWDCSGLTEMAWAQVGVALPHSSSQQYYQIKHVSKANLQLGDLVFFYGLDHVGVYIGNNEVVHAPTPGDVVKVTSLNYMPYAGAGRP